MIIVLVLNVNLIDFSYKLIEKNIHLIENPLNFNENFLTKLCFQSIWLKLIEILSQCQSNWLRIEKSRKNQENLIDKNPQKDRKNHEKHPKSVKN